jgi:hypothetical protein
VAETISSRPKKQQNFSLNTIALFTCQKTIAAENAHKIETADKKDKMHLQIGFDLSPGQPCRYQGNERPHQYISDDHHHVICFDRGG